MLIDLNKITEIRKPKISKFQEKKIKTTGKKYKYKLKRTHKYRDFSNILDNYGSSNKITN